FLGFWTSPDTTSAPRQGLRSTLMTITTAGLTRAAGLAAAVAGAIFVVVQINHPPMEVASAETTEWVARSCAKAVMAALALAGITGMYLRQFRQLGLLGLAGYLLFAA